MILLALRIYHESSSCRLFVVLFADNFAFINSSGKNRNR